MIIDDEIHREFKESRSLNLGTNEIKLEKIQDEAADVRLLEREISEPGLQGVFLVPKVFLNSINDHVLIDAPSVRWIQSAGWRFNAESKIYFGGVNYQKLHHFQNAFGFSNIPSLGSLRIQVSPDEYPLEMNLSREEYIVGPATKKLFGKICSFLDNVLSEDMNLLLKNRSDKLIRSAIVARYSSALMDLWVGNVPSLNLIGTASWNIPTQKVDASPWPQITKLAMLESQFGCLDKNKNFSYYTISDFIAQRATVFAGGLREDKISEKLIESVFQFEPSAKILVSIPSPSFGLFKLRHWAKQELLVPINVHNRCAYGLSFGEYSAPFDFFTGEIDHLGIPVCSGPQTYSILDYRDFMYEVESNPMGGPNITGVLNRYNVKNQFLLNALSRFKSRNDIFRFRK